ncbi:MAG: hypothetical protein D6748_11770, partial [Calditrichaeota bacterium]
MKRLRWHFLVVAVASFSIMVTAQETRYAGAFLELGIGARGMAMGSAYVSVADDGSAFFWNPAGAATLVRAEASGMYASLFKSLVTHFHVGFTRPLYGAGAISFNWVRLSISDIPRYDSPLLDDPTSTYDTRVSEAGDDPLGAWTQFALTNAPLGYSESHDDALFITLAKLNKLNIDFGWQYFVIPVSIPIGFNLKLIRQSVFGNTGSGIGFDFGAMLKFGVDDLLDDSRLGKLSIGLAIKDIWNTKITWDTQSRHADQIKRSWQIGGSYLQPLPKISGQLLIAYSLNKKFESPHNLGVEYLYYNRLALRFGMTGSKFT